MSTLVVMVKRGHEVDVEYSKKNILDKMNNFLAMMWLKSLNLLALMMNKKLTVRMKLNQIMWQLVDIEIKSKMLETKRLKNH